MKLIENLLQDVTYTVNERIKNPFWFSFVISFLFFNISNIVLFFDLNKVEETEEKLNTIQQIEFLFWKPFLWAFLGFLFFYIVQLVTMVVVIIVQERLKPNLYDLLKSKKVAMADRVKGLKDQLELFKKQIDELEDENLSLRNKLQNNSEIQPPQINILNESTNETNISNQESISEFEALSNIEYYQDRFLDQFKKDLVHLKISESNDTPKRELISAIWGFIKNDFPENVERFLRNPDVFSLRLKSKEESQNIKDWISEWIESFLKNQVFVKLDMSNADEANRIYKALSSTVKRRELRNGINKLIRETYSPDLAEELSFIADLFMNYDKLKSLLFNLLVDKNKFIDSIYSRLKRPQLNHIQLTNNIAETVLEIFKEPETKNT